MCTNSFPGLGSGWVRFRVPGGSGLVYRFQLTLDGLTLRRSSTGRPYLAYPSREDRRGGRHPIIRPVGEIARRTFERQVFEALGLLEGGL